MESKQQRPFSYQSKHQQVTEQWTEVITQITLNYHRDKMSRNSTIKTECMSVNSNIELKPEVALL